jgi:hypothetical protein
MAVRRMWDLRELFHHGTDLPMFELFMRCLGQLPGGITIPQSAHHLAAHPGDPDVLVGGAISFSDAGGDPDRPISHAFVTHDRGRNWQTILLPACRVDPWLDIDSDGAVYFSCLSAFDDRDRVIVHRPNTRVTTGTSCPGASAEQKGVARRWQFGGDYSGLAAGADGAFHIFWADSRTGLYQIWHRTMEVAGTETDCTSR